jgi:catechol 2,3-dioxygenase-like lactoylglutathione lyase family enzyme
MPHFSVKGLGEIAIRCADLDAMVAFYRDVIGLKIVSDSRGNGNIVFFGIGEEGSGVGGHTTVLALFAHNAIMRGAHPDDAGPPVAGAKSSLHHLALTILAKDHDAVLEHYTALGLTHRVEHFGWVGWKGIFTDDPEGNTVELVAYNPDWKTDED